MADGNRYFLRFRSVNGGRWQETNEVGPDVRVDVLRQKVVTYPKEVVND